MRTSISAVLLLLVSTTALVFSSALPSGYAQTAGPQGDEFNINSFTAPFAPVCGHNAANCPDPQGPVTWSLNTDSPGKLRIWTQFGSLRGPGTVSNNARNMILQPVSSLSDYTVTTAMTFPAAAVTGAVSMGQTAGIIVYQDDDNFIYLGRNLSQNPSSSIEFVQEVAGVDSINTVPEAAVAPAPQPIYLRIQKVGTLYQGSFSSDNVSFTQILPGPSPSPTPTPTVRPTPSGYQALYNTPQIGLFAWGGINPQVSNNIAAADFDWFRVGSNSVTPGPTALPTATNTPVASATGSPGATPTGSATVTASGSATVTPTNTAVVRATITPTPTPTNPAIVGQELIVNGGFEAGQTPWQESSGGNYQVVGATKPHSGSFGVWLCGSNNCNDQIWQTVTVPANFASIVLTYWLYIDTQEVTSACNDTFTAQLRAADASPIATVTSKCNSDATNSWVQVTTDVTGFLRPYAGQQVQVYFQGLTNGSYPTDYFVDDVSMMAQVLIPTATPTSTITPTPAPTNTPTSTPTSTPTPTPAVQITGLDLLRSVKGEIVDTCDVVLANNVPLQPTGILSPNQTGIFRVLYRAVNAGSNTPSGQVVYEEKGKVVDGDLLLPGKGSLGPFLCATVSFSGKGVHHYSAKFTLTLGSASDIKTLFFTVGKCTNGTTGNKGQCIKCKKGYKLQSGKCVLSKPKKKKKYEDRTWIRPPLWERARFW